MPTIISSWGQQTKFLGRNWLAELKLEWQELYLLNNPNNLQTTLDHHKAVFSNELGGAKGVTAKLHVSGNTKLYYCRAQLIPHALKRKMVQELECLKQQKVIELELCNVRCCWFYC